MLYGSMLFTTAIGLDFVFRGTERMGLVALSLCIRTGIYAFGVLFCVRDASRIVVGSGLADRWRGGGIGLIWLSYLKNYRLPRPRHQPAVPLDHGAARANGLPDPAFSGGDHLGRPAGRRVLEFLGRRRALRGAVPDGDGTAHVRPDSSAGRVSDALASCGADKAGAGREALDSLVEVLMTGSGAGGGRVARSWPIRWFISFFLRLTPGRVRCWRWASGGHRS